MTEWSPVPEEGLSPRWSCTGEGPRVVTLGPIADGELEAAGYERCALSLPADVDAWVEGVGSGRPLANRVLGAVAAGVRQKAPVGIVLRVAGVWLPPDTGFPCGG